MSISRLTEYYIHCDIEGCLENDNIIDSDLPVVDVVDKHNPDLAYGRRYSASEYYKKHGWKTDGCGGHVCPKCATELKGGAQ